MSNFIKHVALKFDSFKLQLELLPANAICKIAETFTHGACKYGEENWRLGFSYQRCIGAMERHLSDFKRGQDVVEDSGLMCLASVAFYCIILITFTLTGTGKDDRIKDLNNPKYQIRPGNKNDIKRQEKLYNKILFQETEKRKAREALSNIK